jgi:uncharacterized delta-60 repeat protein
MAAFAVFVLSLVLGPAGARAQTALDPTFGQNGLVVLPDQVNASLNDVATFEDGPNTGKTVAVGGSGDGPVFHPIVAILGSSGLERENSDQIPGALLPSGAGGQTYWAVAIDSNGKILVAGRSSLPSGGTGTIIARYGPDAQLDTSTDSDPGVAFGPNGQGYVLLPDSLGIDDLQVISTGPAVGDLMLLGNRAPSGAATTTVLMRISSTGTSVWTRDLTLGPDPSSVDTTVNNVPAGLAIDDAGRAVVAGYTWRDFQEPQWGVVRYTADGDPDTGFGDGGGLTIDGTAIGGAPSRASALSLDPGGRIVVAGTADGGVGVGLARLLEDGSRDPTFGSNGWAVSQATPSAPSIGVNGIEATANGIYGGGAATRSDGRRVLAAMRFTNSGELDSTFGADGLALAVPDSDVSSQEGQAIALDGRGIVVVGQAGITNPLSRYAIAARFLPDGGHVPDQPVDNPGSGGVAGDVATSRGIDVHKVITPKSWKKLINPGVRVLASCNRDCRMDVTVTVSSATVRAAGLSSTTVARGSTVAAGGEQHWVTAKAIPSIRKALRAFSGHGRLHINVTAAAPS